MAQFPKAEPDIIALARAVLRGFIANPDIFPNPPIDLSLFAGKLDMHDSLEHEWNTIQAQSVLMTGKKKANTDDIGDDLHTCIRYAEMVVQDDAQLALINWSGRAARSALEIPGQCLTLEATVVGNGSVRFTWKAPMDGGRPNGYELQRYEPSSDTWVPAGMAMNTEKTITGQPTGGKVQYRVYAGNKAGDGPVSNVVVVIL